MALPELAPSSTDRPTVGFVREIFSEARREKRKYLDRWGRYYRMLRNKMWSESRVAWLPAPQSSEIMPTIATLVAWMTDQRPHTSFSPAPDLDQFSDEPVQELVTKRAQDMEQIYDSWWVTSGMRQVTSLVLWDTLTYGCGIFGPSWNPALAEGQGDAVCRRVDPYRLLPDPQASSFEDCRYVIEAGRVPLYEIRRRFPERGHLVEPDQESDRDYERPRDRGRFQYRPSANLKQTGVTGEFPGTDTPGIPSQFAPPRDRGPEEYTGSAFLIEAWIRDTEEITVPVIEEGERIEDVEIQRPYWQYVAVADNIVLTPETDNPFDHGELPYVRCPMIDIGEFWGLPLIEHLGPAQVALNRLLAATQINAELVGNPILLEDETSGISRTKIINRPGGRLTKNRGSDIHWLDPPQMPPAVNQLISFWRDTIDRISGISAVARGASLRRREPAQAVDAVQEASFVRVRAVIRNYEEALRQVGDQIASNVVQFYAEPRAVPIVGPRGTDEFMQLGTKHFYYPEPDPEKGKITDIPLKFRSWIEAGSSLPISRQARAAEADALFFAGLLPPRAVLEAHDWPDSEKTLKELTEYQQQMSEMGVEQGQNPRRDR